MPAMETVYDAREKISYYDPMLARNLGDAEALAVSQLIGDARTAGISAGVFWGVVVALVGYMGYKAISSGSLKAALEPGEE
jgi:uncharacterized membrane protein